MAVLSDLTSSKARHRIFISYSHDSDNHRSLVKRLADTLGSLNEMDCVIDQYVPGEHPIEGWPRWMEQQFNLATRVLCVCTERYFKLLSNDQTVDDREGRGTHWESDLFLSELYKEKSVSKKIKAIVADGSDPDKCIPSWLSKWGWLNFPATRDDAHFKKILAYIWDIAAAPGSGLPQDSGVLPQLNLRERDFLDWIKKDTISTVENVKLFGMSKPIKLADLYYPAVLSTTIARRLYESEWKRFNSDEKGVVGVGVNRKKSMHANFVIGSEFVDKTKKSIILGGPGAGKTTFLKSLALRYCGSVTDCSVDDDGGFAVFVHLPTVSKTELSILDWLDQQATLCCAAHKNMLSPVANKVPTTFLLDSLDEVPVANRVQMVEKIRILERQFPNARIVISCRTADYQDNIDSFVEVEIARLSSDGISKIVSAWFSDQNEDAEKLLRLISSDDGVRSLTETPLLLSLLCIQFRHDLDLPKRKVELYSRCVSVLLRDWDSGRRFRRTTNYEQLTDDRKTKLFEYVAGHFMGTGERYDLPVMETQKIVGEFVEKCGLPANEAEGVIREIESLHGIIERLSQDHYCFSHNTLQEYFCACRIIATRDEIRVVQERLGHEAWEPVIEFLGGILDEPFPIFNLLIKASNMNGLANYPAMAKRTKILSLLYKCLCSSPLLSKVQRDSVVNHIVQSHYQMAKIYGAGGVYPFAMLREEGVTHTYLWTKRRPTLAEALKPFRKLSNLIYLNPIREYGEAVLRCVDARQWRAGLNEDFGDGVGAIIQDNLAVSLLVPIARAYPEEVKNRLQLIIDRTDSAFVRQALSQTVKLINKKHL